MKTKTHIEIGIEIQEPTIEQATEAIQKINALVESLNRVFIVKANIVFGTEKGETNVKKEQK